jgi:hypothetical protein
MISSLFLLLYPSFVIGKEEIIVTQEEEIIANQEEEEETLWKKKEHFGLEGRPALLTGKISNVFDDLNRSASIPCAPSHK